MHDVRMHEREKALTGFADERAMEGEERARAATSKRNEPRNDGRAEFITTV